ncbi:MAG: hypothetical protein M1830_002394 [Pleopsidium flavum]|nr:MAG: hypothetical protein M1830_002475 [Pleopsidium flavum]KAI9871840.1 MAG: hypothetical protein M1830_002394 [Pleopsidium flavum]
MASFFFSRNKSKAPTELVKHTKDLLPRLWEPAGSQKTEEELARLLAQMKLVLQGTQETDSSPEQAQQLVTSVIQEDLLVSLARSVHLLPFESRKDTQTIFSYVLRFKPPNSTEHDAPALAYVINNRPEIIIELCRGYEHKESAMPCGTVLREILKHDEVAEIILYDQSKEGERVVRLNQIRPDVKQTGSGIFWKFFAWIDRGAFEVSTDAFTTFREILTKHKQVVPQYLATNFDLFFSRYNSILVQSPSYVTKRQSIKLLGEILLDRANYTVMTAYVDRGEHLKLCMNLLKDDRKMVQYEGFHVFKVFVANPHKSVAVQRIILNNRDRLLKFLPKFLEDRTEDDQFTDEKSFLVRQIETMPPVPVEPAKGQNMVNGNGNGAVAASVK